MDGTARKRGRPAEEKITENQRRALAKLAAFIERHGFPPTMSELGDLLGITPASAHNLVKQLERKGYVRRHARKARNLQVLRQPEREFAPSVAVPVLGVVKAGPAMLAEENRVGTISVGRATLRGGNARGKLFALKISGDSMIDAGIQEGDLAIIQQQPIAEQGDIIVALLDGDATVKRLHISTESIELRPANDQYVPIVVQPDSDFRVLGKVVGVVSGYEV